MRRIQLQAINTNLLVALDALLKASSVTGAARRIGVTPSAMSHSLRQLRELLDDSLLVRTQRGMRLTPRAQALGPPLARALADVERALHEDEVFDPRTAVRRFTIAAPDFLGAEILTRVTAATWQSCPGIDFDLLPSARRHEAWRLENAQLDAVVGGVIDDMADVARVDLYTERFVVIARRDHPEIRGSVTADALARWPHALIGLDDTYVPGRSWVEMKLGELGLQRRVAVRQRFFVGVLGSVAATDLVSVVPNTLARWGAERFGLQVVEPPFALPTYPEQLMWHTRMEHDPGHRWFRQQVATAADALAARTPYSEPFIPWMGSVPPVPQE